MMASSTMIPTRARAPASWKLLMVKSTEVEGDKVPMIAVGIASRTFKVALQEPRKRKHPRDVRMTERTSALSRAFTESRMNSVESKTARAGCPCLGKERLDILDPLLDVVGHLNGVGAALF